MLEESLVSTKTEEQRLRTKLAEAEEVYFCLFCLLLGYLSVFFFLLVSQNHVKQMPICDFVEFSRIGFSRFRKIGFSRETQYLRFLKGFGIQNIFCSYQGVVAECHKRKTPNANL